MAEAAARMREAGRLPDNILYFARTLRGAGMRVGPAQAIGEPHGGHGDLARAELQPLAHGGQGFLQGAEVEQGLPNAHDHGPADGAQ